MDNDLISSHAVSVGKCVCGGGACSVQQHGLCFLSCRVTHARALPLCRSPGLATSQLSRVCSLPCLSDQLVGSRESSSVPTSHAPPPRAGSPGTATPARRKVAPVTYSARATSAVSSRNCFLRLVHTSLTVCWSRPTCRKPHPRMNAGLGHCLAEEAATARLRAGWGGRKATLRVAKGPWHELGRGGQKYGGRRGGFELGS